MLSQCIPAYRARIARRSTDRLLRDLESLQIYEGRDAETKRTLIREELHKRISAALYTTCEPVTT